VPLFLSACLALAPLLVPAWVQDDPPWDERRDELEDLDPRQVDDATLEEMLADLSRAAAAAPDDNFPSFFAARTAMVLFERLRNRGEFARAREVLETGLAAHPLPGDMRPHLYIASSSLASLLADYPASLEAAEAAEASLDAEQRDSALPAAIWSLRAQAMIQMGVPDQAAPWVARAVERAESLRGTPRFDAGVLIDVLTKRSNLRMATESYDLMLAELESVLADEELLAGRPTARARFVLRMGMGHLWFTRGEDEHAAQTRAYLSEALAMPGIQAQDRRTAHLRLGQLELLAGNVDAARGALVRARSLATEMSAGGGAILSMDESLLCALEARAERLREPADPVRQAESRARLRAAYDDLIANWRARPELGGGVGFLRYPAHMDVVAEVLEGELAAAPGEDGRRAALLALARAQAVGDLPEALGAHEPVWPEIEALAPPGGGLLVWLPAPGASHVFAVDAAGSAHARIADARDVRPPREALERLLAQSPAGIDEAALELRRRELEQHGARLGELLLPPQIAERCAAWSALTLVADDLLGPSALALLPVPLGGGASAPLYLARPTAFLPGLAIGPALRARAPLAPAERTWLRDLCLVTDAQASSEVQARFPYLVELPIDAQRIESWCAPFAAARVERLTGAQATLAALAAAPAARVLHFVTHGVRDVAHARPAGLLLSSGDGDEGLLFHEHTAALAAPALAVLSVCSAGRGPERVGDAGASDLSGSFFAAGADAVLLAAADLPFEPVARFVPLLHAELARGATPAEALWRARVELARDPAHADPFHGLASLRVVGLGHRALFDASAPAVVPQAGLNSSHELGDGESDAQPRRVAFGLLIAAAFAIPAWLLIRRRRST
jgi:hypothetical protein